MMHHLEEKRIALLGLTPSKNQANPEKPANRSTESQSKGSSRKRSNSSTQQVSSSSTTPSSSSSNRKKPSAGSNAPPLPPTSSTVSLPSVASSASLHSSTSNPNLPPLSHSSSSTSLHHASSTPNPPNIISISVANLAPSSVAIVNQNILSAASPSYVEPHNTSPMLPPTIKTALASPVHNNDNDSVAMTDSQSEDDESTFIEEDDEDSMTEASDEEEEDENFDDSEEIVIVDDDFYEENLENKTAQEQAQIIQKNINSDNVQFLHTVTVIPMSTSHMPRLRKQYSNSRKRITKKKTNEPSIPLEDFFKRLKLEQLIKYKRYHNINSVTKESSREDLEQAAINHFKNQWNYVSEPQVVHQLLQKLEVAIPTTNGNVFLQTTSSLYNSQ